MKIQQGHILWNYVRTHELEHIMVEGDSWYGIERMGYTDTEGRDWWMAGRS